MRIRSPSLPELHAFAAVVETGSFSRAAERLSVTQGAVSRSVLRLESRLSTRLLDRQPGSVHPTPHGRSYYSAIREALLALEAAVPRKDAEARDLRVAVVSSLNMRWLVPRLPSFHAAHPHVNIVFKPYLKQDDFQREDVDCWIQTRSAAKSRWPAHIRATYVIGRDIVPICPPDLKDAIRRPADLLKHSLLHHVGFPDNWPLWLRSQGVTVERLELGAGFDLAAGLIEAVAANMGVAVVQRCLIERELAQGRVGVPFDRTASTGRGYYLCVPKARPDTPALQAFSAWLQEQAATAIAPT